MKKILPWVLVGLLGVAAVVAAIFSSKNAKKEVHSEYTSTIENQIKNLKTVKNAILQKMPIYEDYATAAKESELRRYLLKDHLRAADAAGVPAIQTDSELRVRLEENLLVDGNTSGDKNYFFYNVPKKYRVFTPATLAGLDKLTERFQKVLQDRAPGIPPVKFAISSATRPVRYQNNLRASNANASFVSSHSYAMSFDIFYDSFFVDFPLLKVEGNEKIMKETRRQMGFLLGESMRRQFRAMLAETLLQLQREGKLYAIWERNQRCYHVTILQPK